MSTNTPRLPSSGGSYRDDGKKLTRVTDPTTADPGKSARARTAPSPRNKGSDADAAPDAVMLHEVPDTAVTGDA